MKSILTTTLAILMAGIAAVTVSATSPDTASAAGYNAKKCGGGTISLNAKEYGAWKKHNSIRANRGLSQLCVHPALQRAARAHSRDMIERDYFAHETKGSGTEPGQRLTRAGYNWSAYGENIAWGSGYRGSPESIMKSWMNSDDHRKTILNNRYKEIGIGAVTGSFNGTKNATMYTADFGTRR